MTPYETIKQSLARTRQIVEGQLQKDYAVLEACPFVVSALDGFYTVKIGNDHLAKVETGVDQPQQFTGKLADDIAQNFKAYNGNGAIPWQVETARSFYERKLAQVKSMGESLRLTALASVAMDDEAVLDD